jgi:hypothetical protein
MLAMRIDDHPWIKLQRTTIGGAATGTDDDLLLLLLSVLV